MTCKDCLHYAAHKAFFEKLNGKNTFDKFFVDAANHCECFTNRSEWVHISYKIGDTVWFITGINGDTIASGSIESINLSQSYDAYCTIRDVSISSPLKGGKIYFAKYIDSIYHSEEEAEKALKDMNNGK